MSGCVTDLTRVHLRIVVERLALTVQRAIAGAQCPVTHVVFRIDHVMHQS